MSADKTSGKDDKDDLREQIRRLEREMLLLRRAGERRKASFVPPFGVAPPPLPPISGGAAGPMLMAWLLSWMYSSATPNAATFDSLAQFAASREAFWHKSAEDFSDIADQYEDAECGPDGHALSAEEKKKIKAALENDRLDPKLVDAVLHAINSLDALQHYRNTMRDQKGRAT